jgi:pantoate--beta-alanine ligase
VELIRIPEDLRTIADARRHAGATVGLVPTMGSLHEGHDGLIARAREDRDLLVVSIFVNRLQFADEQDFATYPRDEAADLSRCERHGVDVVWAPTSEAMFPPGAEFPAPDPGPLGSRFEGASRPGHFAGVLKVVRRLLDVTGPCGAYFGQKDAQQLFLVRRMVKVLDYHVDIVGCPTVREVDGLAHSSRNALLAPDERAQAGRLFLGLSEAAALARAGERDAHVLVASVAREVGAASLARLDYVAMVDDVAFEPVETIDPARSARALVAARFPSARLIDNLLLPAPGAGA